MDQLNSNTINCGGSVTSIYYIITIMGFFICRGARYFLLRLLLENSSLTNKRNRFGNGL